MGSGPSGPDYSEMARLHEAKAAEAESYQHAAEAQRQAAQAAQQAQTQHTLEAKYKAATAKAHAITAEANAHQQAAHYKALAAKYHVATAKATAAAAHAGAMTTMAYSVGICGCGTVSCFAMCFMAYRLIGTTEDYRIKREKDAEQDTRRNEQQLEMQANEIRKLNAQGELDLMILKEKHESAQRRHTEEFEWKKMELQFQKQMLSDPELYKYRMKLEHEERLKKIEWDHKLEAFKACCSAKLWNKWTAEQQLTTLLQDTSTTGDQKVKALPLRFEEVVEDEISTDKGSEASTSSFEQVQENATL